MSLLWCGCTGPLQGHIAPMTSGDDVSAHEALLFLIGSTRPTPKDNHHDVKGRDNISMFRVWGSRGWASMCNGRT